MPHLNAILLSQSTLCLGVSSIQRVNCVVVVMQVSVIIRIHHECDVGIGKSIPRITDWHHKACRVITNDDREGRIYISHPHTNNHSVEMG